MVIGQLGVSAAEALVHLRRYAFVHNLTASEVGCFADHGFGDDGEFGVLALADLAQASERFVGGAAAAAAQDADGLVDGGSVGQRSLQLGRVSLRGKLADAAESDAQEGACDK